jgi:serine phosphatase RsbU (regulator of sigma subunit)
MEFPEASGALLGIFPDEQFTVTTVQLAPGDRLVVYSDGIEVAFCGENIGDNTRWQDELHKRRSLSTEQMLIELSNELDSQSGSLQPKDDLTMIVLEVK